MKKHHLAIAALLFAIAVTGLALWDVTLGWGWIGLLLRLFTVLLTSGLLVWFSAHVLKLFLWRVSRRLAFSYFLIGVVPIPLVGAMMMVALYILAGYFVGHLYHDTWDDFEQGLRSATRQQLRDFTKGHHTRDAPAGVRFTYYRDGQWVGGDARLPAAWQDWWPAERLPTEETTTQEGVYEGTGRGESESDLPIAVGREDKLYVMATAVEGRHGVLALWQGELEEELSRRSGLWVELFRPEDSRGALGNRLTVFGREIMVGSFAPRATLEELGRHFYPGQSEPSWFDRPSMAWVEVQRPLYNIQPDGVTVSSLDVNLIASPRLVWDRLLSHSAEIDSKAILTLVLTAFVLFNIYVVAAMMALLMIYGLSRAVNRLTDATDRMRHGDFGSRITVERRDQIGALQESFNAMANNLEQLIAEAAKKEILEKDLSIARELQQSLLPDDLQAPGALRFATHFEPSSAIGGDYYDFLPFANGHLGVVIADVSGHGLSAGLRMTMVKSALQLLVEQGHPPREILSQLHRLLRVGLRRANRRGFVTATLAQIDADGVLELHNAGHPPTYLLRGESVDEIVLPSPPLGSLGSDFASSRHQLDPGDVVVWLSDGLVEATDEAGDDFGYERVVEALGRSNGDPRAMRDPTAVRDRLLGAVAEHTGDRPPDDDRTLVVMAFRPPSE